MSQKDEKQYEEATVRQVDGLRKQQDEAMFHAFMRNVYEDSFFGSWMDSFMGKNKKSQEPELVNHTFSNREDVGGGTIQVSVKISDVSAVSIFHAYAVIANSARLAVMDAIHQSQMDSINLKRNEPLETLKIG